VTASFPFPVRARALLATLALPGWALAQTALPPIADPAASTAPAHYQSVFAHTPTGVEQDRVDWKQANADVGTQQHHHHHESMAPPQQDAAPAATPPAHVHHH